MSTATKSRKAEAARPVHEVRLGRIKAAIWANETENGVRHNVTLRRIYVDAEGKWQATDSFGRDDLLLLGKVASLAQSWIFANGQPAGDEKTDQEEAGEELHF